MTRRALLPGAVLVFAGGCTSAGGPGFKVLSETQATVALSAEAVYPSQAGTWTFAVTQGDGAGERVDRARSTTTQYRAAWMDEEMGRRSEFWRVEDNGDIVMPVVIDHLDNAVTVFDPPLVKAYGRLEPGRAYTQEVVLKVMDLKRPERQRDQGRGTQTIEYLDDQVLETPLGRFPTSRVVVRFHARLRMAIVNTTTTFYVEPSLGPVVMERQETVQVLGLNVRRRNQTLVLRVSSP